jgi:poly(A) polymerase
MTNLTIATSIVERLQNLGYIAYFTGGWVRDYLLNFPSDDIDIATNASIEVIQMVFPKTISVGVSFGIIIVVEDGHQFEIATFRKERDYIDGRRPQFIEPCSAEEDAKRRDFTINGLFYDPIKKKLLDFVNGERDLKTGILRAIGNPIDRFTEDRLRMLRAIRYSTRFGFQIEHTTASAIIHLAHELFPSVSMERVYQELQKMDLYDTLADSLRLLLKHKLLKVIFSEIEHLEDHVILSAISLIDELPKKAPLVAKLSLLFHDYPLEVKVSSLSKLKLSRKEVQLIEYLDALEKAFLDSEISDSELVHLYSHEHFSISLNFLKHRRSFRKEAFHHEKHMESLKIYVEKIQNKNPLIKAEDLLLEGIPKGKIMGALLKEAETICINERILDKHLLMKKLKSSINWPMNDE